MGYTQIHKSGSFDFGKTGSLVLAPTIYNNL